MQLQAGTRIGPYEIVAPLGAGGMGEVYRARDARLGRDVAVKVLPPLFAADAERLGRFQREAQVLASLNHPGIAQIYGLEESSAGTALVMELVEGQTLADLMSGRSEDRPLRDASSGRPEGRPLPDHTSDDRRGRPSGRPLPLDDALAMARQIAEALEAAHERGIIHRDLKPGNVMVRPDGTVKVLDFGLAGFTPQGDSSAIDATQSPTLTIASTQAGVIIGTAAYMSPEQAAGRPADRRADIWSFGVVLWEMLAGKRLFDGETLSHTLADVLRAPIDLASLPPHVPPAMRELLRRCLDRDVKTRLRDIGEARVAIHQQLSRPERTPELVPTSAVVAAPRSRLAMVGWGVVAIALVSAGVLAWRQFGAPPAPPRTVRLQVTPPPQSIFLDGAVLSPDGTMLAFEAVGPDNRPAVWVRPLDAGEARMLPGTGEATGDLFWSPDSRSIGFLANTRPARLRAVDVAGGAPRTITDVIGFYRGGAWSSSGDVAYGVAGFGLVRVPASGGMPLPLTRVDVAAGETQHSEPEFLPDGRRFVYHRMMNDPAMSGLYLGSLAAAPDAQPRERLAASQSGAVYVRRDDGDWLLFLRDGALIAQRFNGTGVSGEARHLADNVGGFGSGGWFSATADTLVYLPARVPQTAEIVWFDRDGNKAAQVGQPANFTNAMQLSADGTRVFAVRPEPGAQIRVTVRNAEGQITQTFMSSNRIWFADVARGVFSRLTREVAAESSPIVTADGRVIYSRSQGEGIGGLYIVDGSGVGTPEPIVAASATDKHPNDVSPDGQWLLYDDHHQTQQQDLYVVPLAAPAGGGERRPIPFVVTNADETAGQFSPDGRWIAYTTDETGRREVVVQGFAPDRVPATAVGRWTVSTAGGDKPRWSPDGRELYYVSPDRTLMAVPVKPGASFAPGIAVPLFKLPVLVGFTPYDVARDGRFLAMVRTEQADSRALPLNVVLNWGNPPR